MRNWLNLFEGEAPAGVLWHGSDQRVETPYRPLTHFGTELAAKQRALSVLRDWKRQPDPIGYNEHGAIYPPKLMWMHPVHVRIRNALRIRDFNNFEHTPIKLVDMLYYQLHALESWERSEIFQAGQFASNRNDPAGAALLIDIMTSKGYDGFVYRNLHEDPGSDSWVNFHAEQIIPAGEPSSSEID